MTESKERVITDSHREKLRVNIAKAREVRSEKSAERKLIRGADQQRIREASSVIRGLLKAVSTTHGDGSLDPRFCLGCQHEYVDLIPNKCACQGAWRFVKSVQEALGDG